MFSRHKGKNQHLKGAFHLPLNAMTVTHPRSFGEGVPSSVTLSAVVELSFPPDWKRRTIRGVRLVLRGISTLDLGRGEPETDVFFEHCQMDPLKDRDETPEDELKVLDEKMSIIGFKIDFPIEVPASDTVHQGAQIKYYMIFQIIGQNPDPTVREPHLSTIDLERQNHRIPFPPFPDIPPLEHSMTFMAPINVVHDPSPVDRPGEGPRLDLACRSNAPDVGVVEINLTSEKFTVAGPCQLELTLHPSPRTTLFSIVASVRQDQTLTSPRDGKREQSSTLVPFLFAGQRPESKTSVESPALWRGAQAGGTDSGPWSGVISGRLPLSSDTRASTLPGIISPVTLKHAIVFEIFYSVAEPTSADASTVVHGELLRMRVSRPVVFPSCMLIAANNDLPTCTYPSLVHNRGTVHVLFARPITYSKPFSVRLTPVDPSQGPSRPDLDKYYLNLPCPSCSRRPLPNLCQECTYTVVPHIRHDPAWQKDCTKCARGRLTPKGEVDHVGIGVCACVDWMGWYISGGKSTLVVRTADEATERQVERDRVVAEKYALEAGNRDKGDGVSSVAASISRVHLS